MRFVAAALAILVLALDAACVDRSPPSKERPDAGESFAKLVDGIVCVDDADCESGLCGAPVVTDAIPQPHKCAPNECPDDICPLGQGCAHVECGTRCVAPVDVGGDCETGTIYDDLCETLDPCAADTVCAVVESDNEQTSGTCVAPGTSDLGGPCATDRECVAGLFCFVDECIGCDDTHPCSADARCEELCDVRIVKGCVVPALAGEECSRDCIEPVGGALPRSCADGLACDVPCGGVTCCG